MPEWRDDFTADDFRREDYSTYVEDGGDYHAERGSEKVRSNRGEIAVAAGSCLACGVALDDETRPCFVCDVCADHMPGWDCQECRELRAIDAGSARREAS